MTHSALLIAAGALLTSVLAALLFTPSASPEERRQRDVDRLLRALEAQRRVRDARRRREVRRPAHPAAKPEQQTHVQAHDDRAERRAAEVERRQAAKAQAAALKAERAEEKRAARDDRTARRAAEHERKQAAKKQAVAVKAERTAQERAQRKRALEVVPAATEPDPQPAPEPAVEAVDEPKRLSELPLYSWATRIETEDRAPTEER